MAPPAKRPEATNEVEMVQNPGTPSGEASKSVPFVGKNHEKNRRKKEKKRLLKGMTGLGLSPTRQKQAAPASTVTSKRPRVSSGSTPNLQRKRIRGDSGNVEQGGKTVVNPSSSSTPATYAGAVKTGGIKLIITRKGSTEDDIGTMMNGNDLRVIQSAITRMILRSDPGFLVQVERTFLHEGRVLMICKDEKTLEWAKKVIMEVSPGAEDHPGYDARGPRDAPPHETYGVWIPDNEVWTVTEFLMLVCRCNKGMQRKDLFLKYSAKGEGGSLHVIGVRESSLPALKELNCAPYAGYKRVRFQPQKGGSGFGNQRAHQRIPKKLNPHKPNQSRMPQEALGCRRILSNQAQFQKRLSCPKVSNLMAIISLD